MDKWALAASIILGLVLLVIVNLQGSDIRNLERQVGDYKFRQIDEQIINEVNGLSQKAAAVLNHHEQELKRLEENLEGMKDTVLYSELRLNKMDRYFWNDSTNIMIHRNFGNTEPINSYPWKPVENKE